MKIKYCFAFILLLLFPFSESNVYGQIRYGSIEYEIKVNLTKRFPPSNATNFGGNRGRGGMRGRQNDGGNDYLIEKAILYFKDTATVFVTSTLENVNQQRQTFETISYSNFNTDEIETKVNILGESFRIVDELPKHEWKSTGKIRTILEMDCHEAYTKINDSTKIYAWFNPYIIPSVGPESYWNLPGALMGLAYEDGSVTYFAKSMSEDFPNLDEIYGNAMDKKSSKTYTRKEFTDFFAKQATSNARYTNLIRDVLHFF